MNSIMKIESQNLTGFDIPKLDLSVIQEKDRRNYVTIAKTFNSFLESTKQTFSPAAVAEFKAELESRGLSDVSVKNYLARVRKLAKQQKEYKNNLLALAIIDNMFKGLTDFKPDPKIEENEYLTLAELERLIKKANARERLIIRFLAKTGIRVNEALELKITDLKDFGADDFIFQLTGKGNKQRKLAISKAIAREIIQVFQSTVFLFETRPKKNQTERKPMQQSAFYRSMRNLAIKAKIQKTVGCHTFRHTFATLALQSGKSLKWVSQALGHSSTSITADMYIHENHLKDMAGIFDF